MRAARRALCAAAALAALAGPAGAACRVVFDTPPPGLNACADPARLSMAFVGDVLLHGALQRRAYAQGFDALWGAAGPVLSSADIAVANLEGPVAAGLAIGGRAVGDPGPVFDNRVHTSYPIFNYHASTLDGLAALGVDVVTTANNHGMDRGAPGADATLDAVAAAGLAATGTIRRAAPRDFVLHWETPLGRLALIACAFSTNGMPDPERQTLLCYADRDELLALVRREAARTDVAGVVVLPHWGIEYSARPDAAQAALARDLASAGATLVVGTHPHTVQPWEMLEDGARTVPVVHSTGNFVSGQVGVARESGMLAWAELCRAAPGPDLAQALTPRLTVARLGWVPLRTMRTGYGPQLYTVGGEGADGPAAAARAHIDRLVPGHDMGARVICEGEATDLPFEVALQ